MFDPIKAIEVLKREPISDYAGPGKFEYSANPKMAMALYECYLNGIVDEDNDEFVRIERFLMREDSQGFIYYKEFANEELAKDFMEASIL